MTDTPHITASPPQDRWSIRDDGKRVVIMHRVADDDGNTDDGLPARWHDVADVIRPEDADRTLRLLEESTARQQVVAAHAQAAAAAWQEANTLVSAPSDPAYTTTNGTSTDGPAVA